MQKQQVRSFIMGEPKYSFINEIVRPRDGAVFKIGDLVYWNDRDWMFEDQEYQKQNQSSIFSGNIDQIYIIDDGNDRFNIQISLENEQPHSLGRLDLNDIEFDPELFDDVSFYNEDNFEDNNDQMSTVQNNEDSV